ncbi:poly-gamma-glutamate system protein [Leptospira gomenensis]|uniref:Poly-gamma-glutamate system protein n=1 Tax=Leptospira gomenensis TaxID=2484974 RepID=A0A5F1YEP5_9LEPT|nr:poly-gamma-glutamate system protein [Leptospira gomenensis]TGK39528.1 poly-gamma-glutamate system protein [Leptospira gomenensis]TGK43199.1 poly-gamma-glutamate system protein [Leptospira gomenensis]TGK55108.1 poly-gamma-glutamate system protein [Leptospira gomenensis]
MSLYGIVSYFPEEEFQDAYEIRKSASERAYAAFERIKTLRSEKNIPIDPVIDPYNSGLVGVEISSVTSSAGKLSAKLVSLHPDFAAWFVQRFREAGLKPGDTISAGITGSFPALNVAFFAAADAMGLKTIVIGSVSSSQFGANLPGLLWPDMEGDLIKNGFIENRTSFFSVGGIDDRGIGIDKEGADLIRDSISKNGYRFLSSDSFEQSLLKRMRIYETSNILLYVNIGGGTVSAGTGLGKGRIPRGIVFSSDENISSPDSVMKRFLEKKIPILHVIGIESLASEAGMKYEIGTVAIPGSSNLLIRRKPSRSLAAFALAVLILFLWIFSGRISNGSEQTQNPSVRL